MSQMTIKYQILFFCYFIIIMSTQLSVPTCKIIETASTIYVKFFRDRVFDWTIDNSIDFLQVDRLIIPIDSLPEEFQSIIKDINPFLESLDNSSKRIFRRRTFFVPDSLRVDLSEDQFNYVIQNNTIDISVRTHGLYFYGKRTQLHPKTEAKLWRSITIQLGCPSEDSLDKSLQR